VRARGGQRKSKDAIRLGESEYPLSQMSSSSKLGSGAFGSSTNLNPIPSYGAASTSGGADAGGATSVERKLNIARRTSQDFGKSVALFSKLMHVRLKSVVHDPQPIGISSL